MIGSIGRGPVILLPTERRDNSASHVPCTAAATCCMVFGGEYLAAGSKENGKPREKQYIHTHVLGSSRAIAGLRTLFVEAQKWKVNIYQLTMLT